MEGVGGGAVTNRFSLHGLVTVPTQHDFGLPLCASDGARGSQLHLQTGTRAVTPAPGGLPFIRPLNQPAFITGWRSDAVARASLAKVGG